MQKLIQKYEQELAAFKPALKSRVRYNAVIYGFPNTSSEEFMCIERNFYVSTE